MTRTPTEAPMLTVTLTVEDDWESDPLRVVAGIRNGMAALDQWQRKAVGTARQQGRTWDEIGKLASIATIRTVLNFFLEKELRDLEKREMVKNNEPNAR